jgi:hypothetical protein
MAFSIEGVDPTATGQVSRVCWQILEGDGEDEHVVLNANRTVTVNPSATVSFSSSDIYAGEAVVVKRSTDPVRTNNATCHVSISGLAAGRYRLHTDKGLFQDTDTASCDMEIFLGSDSAELYGHTPSSTTNDATVFFRTVEGNTFASTNYTVLWVDISMRCGQDDPVSPDNDCLAALSNPLLGKQSICISGFEPSIGNVAEFIGTVHPLDFAYNIAQTRDCVDEFFVVFTPTGSVYDIMLNTQGKPRGNEPIGNDAISAALQDISPQPNGRVFDVDTPGCGLSGAPFVPVNHLVYVRYNFLQYAHFVGKRCSNDFPWHSRTTLKRIANGGLPEYEFYEIPDGNTCGSQHTRIWQ